MSKTNSPALSPVAHAVLAAVLALSAPVAGATSFAIATHATTAQTLGPGAGQTGTVQAGKSLTVGAGTVAVTVSGNGATLDNQGTIAQTGTGRAVRATAGVTQFVINNGSSGNANAVIRTADADVIQVNVANSSVTLNNWGSLLSENASAGGAQAVDFSSVTGANVVNNHAGGLLFASEADAVRPGANGVVFNAGTIRSRTAGGSSDGIDGQENSGIAIANSGLVEGGRHGITAGQANASSNFILNVTNAAGGVIRGGSGSGINVDGFNGRQLVTVVNHGTILGNGVTGDGDGVDVDALVDITNTGTIRSTNAFSLPADGVAYSEGITAGGGRIVNSGLIEGLVGAGNGNAVGRGITLAGNDIASGPLAGTREGLYGNAIIVNTAGGLIRGQGGSAIVAEGAASGFTVTIDNRAGASLVGGGSGATIRTGADASFVTNAGVIDGAASGKAIAFGAANDSLAITGGNAIVLGGVDGGAGHDTLLVDAGAGNRFAYAGAIADFERVEIRSGTVTLTGQSTYGGDTVLAGGELVLVGANRIDAASALVLAGGTLDLSGAGAQTFASLSLLDSSTIVLGSAPLTFNGLRDFAAGETLALSGGAHAFRLLGDYAGNAAFDQLLRATTIDSLAVTYRFDGTFTNVSAVPEPGAWAMLLGGLALAGTVARRRRRPA